MSASTLHTIDARGCQLHATRETGSPLITVRGVPSRAGVLSWRLPSIPAMAALAERHTIEGERIELLSTGALSSDRPDSPHIRTYYARKG